MTIPSAYWAILLLFMLPAVALFCYREWRPAYSRVFWYVGVVMWFVGLGIVWVLLLLVWTAFNLLERVAFTKG